MSLIFVSPAMAEEAAFTYDKLNRLTSATYGINTMNYEYDSNGNIKRVVTPAGCETVYYRDADGDGYGDPFVTLQSCSLPQGYVADNTDCNDDPATGFYEHPGQTWYPDADADGYYAGSVNTESCTRPAGYFAAEELTAVSVEDNAPSVYNPDQIDSDHDGMGDVSDDFPTDPNYIYDNDSDGIADEWEMVNFGNLTIADAASDSDGDSLTDLQEFTINTDPNVSIHRKWDVNADGKIDLSEAIRALQITSGIRASE